MAKKKDIAEETASFEESLSRLESIVDALESGEVPLDETLKQFETGMKLLETCHSKLNEAEKKLKRLIRDKDGNFSLADEEPLL